MPTKISTISDSYINDTSYHLLLYHIFDYISFLIDKIKEEQIPVVFHTELSNEQMTDSICEATGAKKLLLHSCHNVSKDDFESGATYLSLMEQNVSALKEALN